VDAMVPVNLLQVGKGLDGAPAPVNILWQAPDSVAFVARGREGRSEFHTDPSDEVMYMIKGEMNLHYLTPDGEEKVAVLREGDVIYCPAGTPHSPRFAPDAYLFVMERARRGAEEDRFQWYCPQCKSQIYQISAHVSDYNQDPVSRAYDEFYSAETNRTCASCGHVAPGRPGVPAAR
jgi:3-hydroxyanthranilate 3,4-dioxygenase